MAYLSGGAARGIDVGWWRPIACWNRADLLVSALEVMSAAVDLVPVLYKFYMTGWYFPSDGIQPVRREIVDIDILQTLV